MIVRLAYSILGANLTLAFGAGLLFALGITFGPIWWALYGFGAIVGASISSENWKPGILNLRSSLPSGAIVLLLHASLLFAATGIASRFIDVGWDSLETHQRAVLLIREGWNIVDPQQGWLGQQPVDGLLRAEPSVFTAHLDFSAMYVVASLMADLPFGLEGAKGYRFLLLLMAGILSAHLLERAGVGKWPARAVGFFIGLNPVCLYQAWVLFMDFDVAVYSSLAILALYSLSWKADRRAVCVAAASILLLLISKRSGLAIALPLGGILFLWLAGAALGWWNEGKSSSPVERGSTSRTFAARKFLIFAGVLGLLLVVGAVLLFGASGRQAETRQGAFYSLGTVYRAIFEPDQFDKNLDLVVPNSHAGLPRPVQFGRSLLEKTDIYRGDSMKVPFTWAADEWETFKNIHWPGHGSGGFGPFFSGVLVLAVLSWILALRPWPPRLSSASGFRGLLFISIIGVCFLLPSWWARWVPFVWTLPLFFLLPPLFLRPRNKLSFWMLLSDRNHLIPSLLAGMALSLAALNSVILFSVATGESLRVSQNLDHTLNSLSGQEVILSPGRNLLTKRWLIERKIEYKISDDRGGLIFEMEPSTSRLYQTIPSP